MQAASKRVVQCDVPAPGIHQLQQSAVSAAVTAQTFLPRVLYNAPIKPEIAKRK